MIKHPDLSLLPIDVGFDVRLQGMAVEMPPGAQVAVDYLSRRGVARRVEGARDAVIHTLRAAGYKVA